MKKPNKDFDDFDKIVFPSSNPEIEVRVQKVRTNNREAVIKAYPVYKKTDERVPGVPIIRHLIHSKKQWHSEARAMVGRVEQKMQRLGMAGVRTRERTQGKEANGSFVKASRSIQDQNELCRADWAESTKQKTLADALYVLSRMDALGEGLLVGDADMQIILHEMETRAMQSGRSSKNQQTVSRGVNSRFSRVGVVYQNLRRVFCEYDLPQINFPQANVDLVIQPEQCKSLPDEIRIKFSSKLIHRISEGRVLGAALMLMDGPRTSETVAVYFRDIVVNESYCSIPILRQQGTNGLLTDYLKSEAGYRVLPLPLYMVALINMRRDYLRGLGYSEGEILEMPLVANDDDPRRMASSSSLSAYVKELLTECGFTTQHWLATQVLQANEPDDGSDGNAVDVGAYVLRRDFATRACNICALSPREVDYLLGHKNRANEGWDYQTPQAQRKLGQLLENYVFHPAYSRHPAFAPVQVPEATTVHIEKASKFVIEATEDVEIRVHLLCCEPNCDIASESCSQLATAQAEIRYRKDTLEKRRERMIIGQIPDEAQLNRWIREANEATYAAETDNQYKEIK